MIKLYVDDRRGEPNGWQLAKTITEAIRILATVAVEEVDLDHDIENSEETFEPVARYIALMPKDIRPLVLIHSGNPWAFNKYKEILNY
jgi:hypothetical protein